MRCWWLILTLCVTLALAHSSAYAQAPVASPKPIDKAGATAAGSGIAPDAGVITIQGICGSDLTAMAKPGLPSKPAAAKTPVPPAGGNPTSAAKRSCQTVVTRAQFEKLAHVVAPNQPPQAASQLARFYSTQLLYARKAHELGLDKDPNFDEILRFTYLQVLGRTFTNHLQQQANAKADAIFDTYYKQHSDEFEQVQVLQISVPKQKDHAEDTGTPPANVDTTAEAAAMKDEAEKIRARAIAGEDFEKLESEAYAFANAPNDSPDPDMGDNTRAEMAPFDKEVFALQPGQVSELLSGTEAWHIFKVVSKHMMPPDEARKRIAAKLMKEEMDAVNNSVKTQFNESYFVPAVPANPSGDDTK